MLRLALPRTARVAVRGQWRPLTRTFADNASGRSRQDTLPTRTSDATVLPGSQSTSVAGVPQAPILATIAAANPTQTDVPPIAPPKLPVMPSPTAVPSAATPPGKLPPPGTAPTGPTSAPPPPPPKRPRRRFRNFLRNLIILSALGYAGGVYYALVSDNFHDFFTEYVPFGEDAVAYFEERAYRERFPNKEYAGGQNWPQTRGEGKVTIGKSSGLTARVAEEPKKSDLGQNGRHLSAVEDKKSQPGQAQQVPDAASPKEKTHAVEAAKKDTSPPAKIKAPETSGRAVPTDGAVEGSKPASTPAPVPASAPATSLVDHINVPEATEPVVQDLVKMINNIITTVNAIPEASTFSSVFQNVKLDLNDVINEITMMKEQHSHEADTRIKDANVEFDTAAKELVRRLEQEMHEQETKWREEYESERERLSTSYQQRLNAELDAAKKVAEEKNKNSLLEQEIALQKAYMKSVKSKVEEERNGRLAKIDALSESVGELQKLTGQWNEVIDATLKTQHLQVAVEAVRSKVLESDYPIPFLNELVALKEVSKDDPVVNAAIASINPIAYQQGIPSPANLIDRFRRVASEVRKASLLPEDAGVASHAASAVLSRFMFQKKADRGLPEGDDVEATLARTEVLLEEGDLDAAAREMNGLRGWAGVLSRDWVGECRRVLEVRQAVDVIATEARLQSLLVE
ncbi:hypothetical protein LTR08_003815 [Meristemomyces frigidus]|nr:hypothetical protein LTR08_003815 [Meristemomyces frigidus]